MVSLSRRFGQINKIIKNTRCVDVSSHLIGRFFILELYSKINLRQTKKKKLINQNTNSVNGGGYS